MPSLESPNKGEMATISSSLEVFDTYKTKIDRDSDEESFHLPLMDDEVDSHKHSDNSNVSKEEDNEDILNKLEAIVNGNVDSKDDNNEKNDNCAGIINDTKKTDNVNDETDTQLDNKNEDEENQEKDDNTKSVEVTEENTEKSLLETDHETNDKVEEKEVVVEKEKEINKEIPQEESKIIDTKQNEETEKELNEKNPDDCSKNQNTQSDSEDLLDISVVKDVGEDESECAQNEINLNEEAKEVERDAKDSNNEDEDFSGNGSDKMDDDENEEKNKRKDQNDENDDKSEEVSENIQGQDNDEETEERITVEDNNAELEEQSKQNDFEENKENEKNENTISNNNGADNSMDITTEDCAEKKGVKRLFSEDDNVLSAKKTKTENDDNDNKNNKDEKSDEVIKSLLSLEDFMKNSKNQKKLNLLDLEQFCIQKICEAIVHQSQLGDHHHQLKVYEQTIETMRKEILQLTKQARDLEIVNKKLLNDLKQQNNQKPLQPLKITRSVGLQVKFGIIDGTTAKRRTSTTITQQSSNQAAAATPPSKTSSPAKMPRNSQNTIPLRKTSVTQQKSKTPLLTQALTRKSITPVTSSPVSSSPQSSTTSKKSSEKSGIIDLTDEDDKNKLGKAIIRPISINGSNNNVRQQIRLTTSPKVTPITSGVVSTSSPQVMYVVQPANSNVLGGTNSKTVFVNLQPTNGVLTSTSLNGQVSVISTKQSGGPVHLKSVNKTKVTSSSSSGGGSKNDKLKHPAPLPSPPYQLLRLIENDLKPIPPKPVLTIRKTETGIILQWKMPYDLDLYETIASYQLYAYQETNTPPNTDMWRRVGDVKALALPMACTLTQFADRNKYYFAVRPVDIHKRIGPFSDPKEISL